MKVRRLFKKAYIAAFNPFFRKGVKIKMGEAGMFRFHHGFALGEYRYFGARHNSGFFQWIRMCENKKTVFDVGAHIGLYSIPASKRLDRLGAIYAFEPSRANCEYIEKHKHFNNAYNIRVIPFLVGERTVSRAPFYDSRETSPMNSIIKPKKGYDHKQTSRYQISLDDFCTEHGLFPEIMKIDVEGAELNVLKGARRLLKKSRPVVFLSIHPALLKNMGQSVNELKDFIASEGYRIYETCGVEAVNFKHNEYILMPKGIKKYGFF